MDAKVRGEPHQINALETALAQIASQSGGSAPIVLKKCGIRVDSLTETLADHQLGPVGAQLRVKRRPGRSLHAVIGPKSLLTVGHADRVRRDGAGMVRGE